MEGDYVLLREPQFYMGFIVSPRVALESYYDGRLVGTCNYQRCQADFFSHAAPAMVLDGDWNNLIKSGASLLGKCITLYSNYTDVNTQERTFSVLLYQNPESPVGKETYTIKLLDPEYPDEETQNAFKAMKKFVENLKYHTFNPLYTADFRIMTGRYFRVTVNKCGWLIEDYMVCNK